MTNGTACCRVIHMTSEHTNSQCPDYQSHGQNAEDAWVDANGRKPSATEDFEAIDAIADAEYSVCEGH